MKLRILVAASACALGLVAPATAMARHHGHRHGTQTRHHKRHAHHSRVLHFGSPAASQLSSSGAAPNPTPATPSPASTAGTVASFAGGVLTIKLNDGSTVSGKVTDQTRLRCEGAENRAEVGEDENDGDDGARASESDRSGRQAEDTQTEDRHGDDEAGEDRAGESCTTAALVPGAVVREAELEVDSAGAVWEEVELVP